MPVFRLPNELVFPDPNLSEEDGLLAVGGDLSLERLLLAYSNGIFPWYNEGEPILWWCPKPRFILRPDKIKISKSMKKIMKKNVFDIKFNTNFSAVIKNCRAMRENKEGTWITDDMENAYINLFEHGYALSVEAYFEDKLVGGLYGVIIGKCFFGESMFSKMSNSSKAALIILAEKLKNEGFVFIDCQVESRHLESMGAEFVSYDKFKQMLYEGIGR